jgi:hypothetical protein
MESSMYITMEDLQEAYSADKEKQAEEDWQKFDESLVKCWGTRTPTKGVRKRTVAGTRLYRIAVVIVKALSFLTAVFQFLQQVLPQILEFLSKLFHF